MFLDSVLQLVFFHTMVIESHFYKCSDIYQNTCTPLKCSSSDADKRSLHRCNEWPFWSGGWGSFEEEHESYSCINSTDSYCSVWSTKETKFRTNSTGTCFCVDENLNSTYTETDIILSPNYCSSWICTELQVFTNCKEDPYTETEICEDLLNTEYNECFCIKPSSNDQYCMKWQCLELKDDTILETADYSCDEDDININYCAKWYGDIESEWEFELLDCSCNIADDYNNFCMKWKCLEKEMTKHYSSGDKYAYFHAIFWPLFVGCVLGGSCASGTKSAPATVIMVLVVVCGIGVMSGGVGFLMIWLIIFGGPILLLITIFGCHGMIETRAYNKRQEKANTS